MISFQSFLTEAAASEDKLKHLEHAEDHPINAGAEGYNHAIKTLHAVHHATQGKPSDAHITTKYDGCISGDTEILLLDGTYKTIEQITTEWSLASPCQVVGWDFESNTAVVTNVIDKNVTTGEKDWVIIETEQGTITCTIDHELFVEGRGWVQAGLLNEKDILKTT